MLSIDLEKEYRKIERILCEWIDEVNANIYIYKIV